MESYLEIVKNYFFDEKMILDHENKNFNWDDSLLENGIIDSMNVLKLVSFIEEKFCIKIADDDLTPENFDFIDAIVKLITSKTAEPGILMSKGAD
jgi:acyl carrier protein